jgi:hypothetical protein
MPINFRRLNACGLASAMLRRTRADDMKPTGLVDAKSHGRTHSLISFRNLSAP